MRSVAGQLKLGLAQYREMAAFAQFGSDLDAATQEQLANGERQTEILKQPQYHPMAMEEQVVAIFAATPREDRPSWIRSIPVSEVSRYEREMLSFMRDRHPEILADIRETGALSESTEQKLIAALDEFGELFQAGQGSARDAA